ncbi:MAG: hypothetical protein M1812_005947 [Candelaria pacifica]|nr:MAG: hypothetical protein M1812_005947 [Candelaria pacifica]
MSSSDDDDSLPSSSASPQPAQRDPLLSHNHLAQSPHPEELDFDTSQILPDSSAPALSHIRAGPSDIGSADNPNEDHEEEEEEEKEEEVESDIEEERPNKYHGSASTWRSWTETERSLAGSLDQLRASDLSLHLYNAHALRARLRKRNTSAPGWASKKRWLDGDDEEIASKYEAEHEDHDIRFRPPKGWTAWPLPAAIVPRQGERVGYSHDSDDERWNIMNDETVKASDVLEGVLVGEVLRKAKERFNRRAWADDLLSKPAVSTESIVHSQAPSPSPQGSPKLELQEAYDRTEYSKHARLESEAHLTPVVMADDQEAHKILLPTVRHVLTKLDGILMGLHHARQAYVNSTGETDSELETDHDTSQGKTTKEEPQCKLESRTNPRKDRVKARKRKSRKSLTIDSSSSSEAESTSSEVRARNKEKSGISLKPIHSRQRSNSRVSSPSSERSTSTPPQAIRKKRVRRASPASRAYNQVRKNAALGLRDWSDVLGIASMVGWEPQVIERAAARCSSLFAEGISFRTLEEGDALKTGEGKVRVINHRADYIPVLESSGKSQEQKALPDISGPSEEELSDAVHTQLLCPIAECERSKKAFTRQFNFERHLRLVHGLHKHEIAVGCKNDDSMVGGIHNNGFLQQIPARMGWRGRDIEQRIRPTLEQRRRRRMNLQNN